MCKDCSDKHCSGNSGGGFFLGAVIGGVLGAIAAILVSPDGGETFRKKLKDKSKDLREGAEKAKDKWSELYEEELEPLVKEAISKSKPVISELKEEVIKPLGKELIKTAKEAKDNLGPYSKNISKKIEEVKRQAEPYVRELSGMVEEVRENAKAYEKPLAKKSSELKEKVVEVAKNFGITVEEPTPTESKEEEPKPVRKFFRVKK